MKPLKSTFCIGEGTTNHAIEIKNLELRKAVIFIKTVLNVGEVVQVKFKFKSKKYGEAVRNIGGTFVTIREVRGEGYFIEETKGMLCDRFWTNQDFILKRRRERIKWSQETIRN